VNKFAALMGYIRENMGETELGLNSMLAYIHQETASGSTVNTTKLVRKLCFGTGPTVHTKLSQLERAKLIKMVRSKDDGRSKIIQVTDKGVTYLRGKDREIGNMLGAMA